VVAVSACYMLCHRHLEHVEVDSVLVNGKW